MKWKSKEQRLEYYRKWREKNREKLKKYQREYYKRHHPECLSYIERYRKMNQKEDRARRIFYYHFNKGEIKKIELCQICGKKETEPHHFDYDKPLEVVWLCRSCHKYLHLGKTIYEILDIKANLYQSN